MTNREAIEWFKKRRDGSPMAGAKEMFSMAIAALEKQEKNRWIPVTEQLPEDEYVLISKKPTKLSGSKWRCYKDRHY